MDAAPIVQDGEELTIRTVDAELSLSPDTAGSEDDEE